MRPIPDLLVTNGHYNLLLIHRDAEEENEEEEINQMERTPKIPC
jgi:hypothetical protein